MGMGMGGPMGMRGGPMGMRGGPMGMRGGPMGGCGTGGRGGATCGGAACGPGGPGTWKSCLALAALTSDSKIISSRILNTRFVVVMMDLIAGCSIIVCRVEASVWDIGCRF